MTEEILVNVTPRETRVAVVENGMLICVVRRAPLLPIGSLTTCTTTSWPSRSSSAIGAAGAATPAGGSEASPRAGSGRWMSLACRNAARSRPTSTNAACMPVITRCTLPL